MMMYKKLGNLTYNCLKTLRLWNRRARTRAALARIPANLHADIGYDEVACDREGRKWFWQGEDEPTARTAARDRAS